MPDLWFAIPLDHIVQLVLCAIGITAVVTGEKLGYPLRFAWALLLRPRPLRWLRNLATCPPCNSFWSGALLAWLAGFCWVEVIQLGLTTLAVVKLYQVWVGGDGLAAAENWNCIFDDEDCEEE